MANLTMNKVINLVLLAVVVWFGYTQVLPWFRSLGTGPGSRAFNAGGGEDGECVMAARQAAEVFSEVMRGFSRPPIDRNEWDSAYLRIENRITNADDRCSCSRPACSNARAALSDLRGLADDFSIAARSDGAPPINAASSLSRIYDNLDRAAEVARGIRDDF